MSYIDEIGSGPSFPIKLTELPDGTFSWRPLEGEVELLKEDIIGLLQHNVGDMIRQEMLGHRLQEVLEEPNTSVAEHLAKKFLMDFLNKLEPRLKRITSKDILIEKTSTSLNIQLKLVLLEGEELDFVNINIP